MSHLKRCQSRSGALSRAGWRGSGPRAAAAAAAGRRRRRRRQCDSCGGRPATVRDRPAETRAAADTAVPRLWPPPAAVLPSSEQSIIDMKSAWHHTFILSDDGRYAQHVQMTQRPRSAAVSASCWKLTLMAAVHHLQVCAVRNLYVEKGFNPAHFLSHAAFDCGSLEH